MSFDFVLDNPGFDKYAKHWYEYSLLLGLKVLTKIYYCAELFKWPQKFSL